MWSKTSQTEENNKETQTKEKIRNLFFFLTTDGIFVIGFLYIIRKQFDFLNMTVYIHIHWRKEVKGNEEVGEHLFGIGDFIGFLIWLRRRSERRKNQVSKMRRRFHSSGGFGRASEENAVVRFTEET